MSTDASHPTRHAGHSHGGLSANQRTDPTQTATLRRQFSQQFGARWRFLKGVVWRSVGVDDAMGMKVWNAERIASNVPADWPDRDGIGEDVDEETLARELAGTLKSAFHPIPSETVSQIATDEAVERFTRWLAGSMDEVIIGRDGGEWTAEYIRYAYARGLEDATRHLRDDLGVDVPQRAVEDAFNIPVHRDVFETVFHRNLRELDGITAATEQEVQRELATGILRGENPRVIARRINDRLDSVGLTRSRALARTETIRAYNEATLTRYQRILGPDAEVTAQVEFVTAGDDRVCPECQDLAGQTFTISEARGTIPVHPNCRCRWVVARR